MVKKLLIALLSVMMLFAFVSCDDSAEPLTNEEVAAVLTDYIFWIGSESSNVFTDFQTAWNDDRSFEIYSSDNGLTITNIEGFPFCETTTEIKGTLILESYLYDDANKATGNLTVTFTGSPSEESFNVSGYTVTAESLALSNSNGAVTLTDIDVKNDDFKGTFTASGLGVSQLGTISGTFKYLGYEYDIRTILDIYDANKKAAAES